jgi:hypothetical protein
MTEQSISWEQDGIDSGWFFAKNVGSVRSSFSYRPWRLVVPSEVVA